MDWKNYVDWQTKDLVDLIHKRRGVSFNDKAQAAFHAFSYRFTSRLTKQAEIVSKKWGLHNEDAIEIVQRTFKRFLKYGANFDFSKSKTRDYDTAVLLYLNKIARNVLIDYHSEKLGLTNTPYKGDESIIYDSPVLNSITDIGSIDKPKKHEEVVAIVLSKLSEKHKTIYLTYSAYQFNGYKMPRKLLKQLRECLELKQATVQAYKKETIDKINEYLKIYGIK